jgi:spore coat polysaccharide biosynthesis protein SpsF (cytidylyltransferase family)
VLAWVLARASAIPGVDQTVLATSTNAADARLVDVAREQNVDSYAGSELDVLDRYVQAACRYDADAIVRITADCPLLDPEASGRVVARFMRHDVDYASNVHPRSVPDGMDTEMCSRQALETAWHDASASDEREHVTPHIWRNPTKFRVAGLGEDPALAAIRLTVDYQEDLDRVRAVYAGLRRDERATAGIARILTVLRSFEHTV